MITLLTDFGSTDYFVGAMKGTILSINPEAKIIDITHEVPAHDIEAGAFTLLSSYSWFPKNTIHLAVVDPGVGSDRRPILVSTEKYFFIGPDNGLFGYIYDREPGRRVFHLNDDKYFLKPISSTFHGRDVFAPVAATLSKGEEPQRLGSEIKNFKRLAPLSTERLTNGSIKGRIIHIDHFGNCITNISSDELDDDMIRDGAYIQVCGREIREFRSHFEAGESTPAAVFAVWGSAGFLEIVAFQLSAAVELGAVRGTHVFVETR